MKKNVASQAIGAQMVSATDGSAFTSAVTVYVTGDAGTQAAGSVGAGACTHEGNGFHTYAPAQAETNYDHVAFTFIGTGAVPATVQAYTTFPQTGDNFARLGAPAGASFAADIAAVQADTDNIQTRIPAALVGGRIDASAGAMAANVITAASTAADFLAEINAEADTAISDAALATAANLATVAGYIDTEIAAILADTNELQTDWADGGRLDNILDARASQASVDTIDDFLDTEVAAIKAKTDGLTFTVANQVDVNVVDWKGSAAPAMTGDAFARLGAPAGASVSADVAAVQSDTNDIQARLPAALISGRIDASVGAMAADVLTAAATAADFTTEVTAGLSTLTAAGVRTAVGLASADLDTQLAALPTAAENADAVWEEDLSDHSGTVGSTAEALAAASAAGDPWSTPLPGAYGAGTAGKIVGDNLDAAVSSRASAADLATVDGIVDAILVDTAEIGAAGAGLTSVASAANLATVAGYVDTEVAAIKAKTDNLPSDPADASDIASAFGTVNGTLGTIAGYIDTEVGAIKTDTAAIKLKTDNLPADPADASDIASAFTALPAAVSDAVWEETLADHSGTAGSTAAALASAGTAGDPWAIALPGAYGAGTAGKIVGDGLDAAVSSRASAADLATLTGFVDTEVAAIKAYADRTVCRGTVGSTSPTVTSFTPSALDPAGVDADQFKGRIIIFDKATATAALRGQATDIVANTAAGLPLLTFSSLSSAPADGDTFSIV